MKLIESKFDNFRCFKRYEIKYGTETTVFIGKNGTGKSSVLSGIRRGLSFMFAKPKNHPKNIAISNNAQVQHFKIDDANFDSLNRVYNYPINNHFKAIFNKEDLNWSMVKEKQNGGYLTNHYKDVLNVILGYYNQNLNAPLPVLAVITDSFPHEKSNLGSKAKKTVSGDILPRDMAYYGWDERTNCTDLWLNRFYKVSNFEKDLNDEIRAIESQIALWESRLKDAEEYDESGLNNIHANIAKLHERLKYLHSNDRAASFSHERLFIENKLLDFSKPISGDFPFINEDLELFRVRVNRPDKTTYTLEFDFKDSRVITFEMLPMGYKRIFSMVIDIAYRSYILNQGLESQGIVLIDEIELHLHPTLQQDILQRLRATFPNIQFIVTTHSPLVIGNFKADNSNKIIKLEHEGNNYFNQSVENVYGVDYNTGITEVMAANYLESEIDKLIDSIVILRKFGKEDQANRIETELIKLVGENNKHIEAEISKRLIQNNSKS